MVGGADVWGVDGFLFVSLFTPLSFHPLAQELLVGAGSPPALPNLQRLTKN